MSKATLTTTFSAEWNKEIRYNDILKGDNLNNLGFTYIAELYTHISMINDEIVVYQDQMDDIDETILGTLSPTHNTWVQEWDLHRLENENPMIKLWV